MYIANADRGVGLARMTCASNGALVIPGGAASNVRGSGPCIVDEKALRGYNVACLSILGWRR